MRILLAIDDSKFAEVAIQTVPLLPVVASRRRRHLHHEFLIFSRDGRWASQNQTLRLITSRGIPTVDSVVFLGDVGP
jgi:hypothetical protein